MRPRWTVITGVRRAPGPAGRTEFIGTGLSRPGYNLLTRGTSDLATRGVAHAEAFTTGFFCLAGGLTARVGLGLWRAASAGRVWRIGSARAAGLA